MLSTRIGVLCDHAPPCLESRTFIRDTTADAEEHPLFLTHLRAASTQANEFKCRLNANILFYPLRATNLRFVESAKRALRRPLGERVSLCRWTGPGSNNSKAATQACELFPSRILLAFYLGCSRAPQADRGDFRGVASREGRLEFEVKLTIKPAPFLLRIIIFFDDILVWESQCRTSSAGIFGRT